MPRAGLTVVLAAPAVLLAGGALLGGWNVLWLPAAGLGCAAALAFVRARHPDPRAFPTVDIEAEGEVHGAFLRLTNRDEPDSFTARILRVSLEDTLSTPPPWPLPWEGGTGTEAVLHHDESRRIEIGRIAPGPDEGSPELHFARAPVAGHGGEIVMPWPTNVVEHDHVDTDYASRRVRAEIEITSERTGAVRLAQVKIGVLPPANQAEVQLVSIDMGRVRHAIA